METLNGIVREYKGVSTERLYEKLVRIISAKDFSILDMYLRPYDAGEQTAHTGRIRAYREGASTGFYSRESKDLIDTSIDGQAGATTLNLNVIAKDTDLANQILRELNAFVGDSRHYHHIAEGVVDDACQLLCKR